MANCEHTPPPRPPSGLATIFSRRQRVRTFYQHSETATIVGKEPAHVLDGRWYVVQWDDGGGACIHEGMLVASNEPPFKGRLPLIHKVRSREVGVCTMTATTNPAPTVTAAFDDLDDARLALEGVTATVTQLLDHRQKLNAAVAFAIELQLKAETANVGAAIEKARDICDQPPNAPPEPEKWRPRAPTPIWRRPTFPPWAFA